MLKAMKEQLKSLAQDHDGTFHVNLRRKIGKRATQVLEKRLKQIIVLTPDLVARIYAYWEAEKAGTKTKKLGSYLLTYLYLPKDFISEEEWGLFGYLDDAYFVAKMYTTVIEEMKDSGIKIRAGDINLYDQVKMLQRDIRIVIPKEAKDIDQMINELSEGKKTVYYSLVGQD